MVYAKWPFAGLTQVLESPGRYSHRVTIANERLLGGAKGHVRFRSTELTAGRWKDSTRGNRLKTMTLPAEEVLCRFLLHVLPAGFVRIRNFGFLANRTRIAKLARCRAHLAACPRRCPRRPSPWMPSCTV